MIPEVAASEPGRAQTDVRACRGSDCISDSLRIAERYWKDRRERVKAPYAKSKKTWQDPEYNETRETLLEEAGTTP